MAASGQREPDVAERVEKQEAKDDDATDSTCDGSEASSKMTAAAVFKLYAARFQEDEDEEDKSQLVADDDERAPGNWDHAHFGWAGGQQKPEERIRAELETGLGMKTGSLGGQRPSEAEKAARTPKHEEEELRLTFGYAGSLDKRPPFARFDIRDGTCLKYGGFKHGEVVRDAKHKPVRELVAIGVKPFEGQPQLWFQPRYQTRPAALAFPGATADLLRESLKPRGMSQQLKELAQEDFDYTEDADGEVLRLCSECRLPIGDVAYAGDGDATGAAVHGECTAQCMLRKWSAEETARHQEEAARKAERRREYGIGWKGDQVPSSSDSVSRLGFDSCDKGMCCLTLSPDGLTLGIEATAEPAVSVNLEYLSTVLRVRLLEGREPYFSLDPVHDETSSPMQSKQFSPSWLAGTSVGEVLFQADYHLKELSMGEYAQPVLGMKSSFDFFEDAEHEEWSAREWFMINDASIQLSADNVLSPHVQMGIEARAQIKTDDGFEDAPLTRVDHPLVQYANEFTHHFDLIAERKSVIFHLRELAKATVLAKFISEAGLKLEDAWTGIAPQLEEACCLEVPQLWNERRRAQIELQDGAIVNEGREGQEAKQHTVYGGVSLGLERFSMQPARDMRAAGSIIFAGTVPTIGSPARRVGGLSGTPITLRIPRTTGALGTTSGPAQQGQMTITQYTEPWAAEGTVKPGIYSQMFRNQMLSPDNTWRDAHQTPFKTEAAVRAPARAPARDVAGVDLNLDGFDLATLKVQGEAVIATESVALSDAFWATVDLGVESSLKSGTLNLLKDVFNPFLSDRRDEGDRFVPPETSPAYVQHLRSLVKEEEVRRDRRKRHFCSNEFKAEDPGSLFPFSWKASFEIARPRSRTNAKLHERSDYKEEPSILKEMIRSAAPDFDKCAEDGMRFRIYRFGSIEVRTTQEFGRDEVVEVVFSIHPESQGASRECHVVQKNEVIVKATQYVERNHNIFVVLETAHRDVVVTEMLEDGTVTWETNPEALDVRSSFSKVFSVGNCRAAGVSAGDLRQYQAAVSSCSRAISRKGYAEGVYRKARGMQL